MSKEPARAITMNWYKRENYGRTLKIMDDANLLSPTYEKWQYAAHKGERDMQAKGYVVIRVVIDPDKFIAWCARNKVGLDAKARNHFAGELAQAEINKRN